MVKKRVFPSLFYKILLWLLFFGALVRDLHLKGGGLKQDTSFEGLFFLFTSALAVVSYVVIIELTSTGRWRRYLMAASAFVFGMTFYYLKRVATPFSFDIIMNNSDAFYYIGTWKLLAQLIHNLYMPSDYLWSIVFAVLIYYSEAWGRPTLQPRRWKWIVAVCVMIMAKVAIVQPYSIDPMTNFLRSTYHFYKPKDNIISARAKNLNLEPLHSLQSHFDIKRKPNIFLVLVESFNSRFVNQKNEQGIEYTPTFNSLTQKNLYFPKYYSNSIQTAKGHFAAICGQINRMDGMAVSSVKCFNRRCVPSLIEDLGYQTHFIQADPNYNYDGNVDFVKKMAKFQNMPKLFKPCRQEQKKCYGLGLHDRELYVRAFEYMNNLPDKTKPQFVVMATIANHMPFKFQSEEERSIYKNPQNFKEHYLNSLRMTDDGFATLMEQYKSSPFFENSILIITGDHGFPTGEHGSNHNENYAFQENFGVPLLIMDSRTDLKAIYGAREQNTYSHLNLGATIMDLVGYKGSTDFISGSIFSLDKHDLVYLVQPYSGGYQAVIAWPYKYIFEEHKEREHFYDLEADPGEKNPIPVSSVKNIDYFRDHAAVIYRQQEIFECNPERRKKFLSMGQKAEM